MGNDLLTPPETPRTQPDTSSPAEGHDLDALLGKAFTQKPLWRDLYDNVHDVFFPPKLPPLELTSKPVAVVDRMAVKRNPIAMGIAAAFNIAVLLIVIFLLWKKVGPQIVKPPVQVAAIDNIEPYRPILKITGPQSGGGGGGGSHSAVQASQGHIPKPSPQQITPPTPIKVDHPKLAVEPTVNVQKDIKLPDDPTLPNVGLPSSHNNVVLSQGTGTGGGMGNGKGTGLGGGSGNGVGNGSGGNYGGGIEQAGRNGVSAPIAIYQPEAEFSDEARRNKYQGEVVVSIIVDAQGHVQSAHIQRSLGEGLDEKALEAVRQYRFKPAMKAGKPVPVYMSVAVNFQLF